MSQTISQKDCRPSASIVYLVTSSVSLRFFRGQLTFMQQRGLETWIVSSPGCEMDAMREESQNIYCLAMNREIAPLADLRALAHLYRLFRDIRPTIINASTPKAALLGMVSARLAGVPVRIYTVRGLRLETATGFKRALLGCCEWITARCAHRVVCVSESLKTTYLQMRLTRADKVKVVGCGSSNGVDADRFSPACRSEHRSLFDVPPNAPMLGYVGRLTRDKGVMDLVDALDMVLNEFPETRLAVVGDFEEGDPIPLADRQRMLRHPNIVFSSFTNPEPFYSRMDILLFPSYREGFPNVPLEAAAAETPVVGYQVTGTVDAVVDGVTGTLVPAGDVRAFAQAICRYLENRQLLRQHGHAARQRVLRDFQPVLVWEALYDEYVRLLTEKKIAFSRMENSNSTCNVDEVADVP